MSTTGAAAAPAAPSAVETSDLADGRARVQWQDNSSNETSFRVQRQTQVDGSFNGVPSVTLNAEANAVSLENAAGAGVHRFRVRACARSCSAYTPWSVVTVTASAPPAPAPSPESSPAPRTATICPDFDQNGSVNAADIAGVTNALYAGDTRIDYDHNGRVEPADLSLFINNYYDYLQSPVPGLCPEAPPVAASGYSRLMLSSDSRVIYVSSSYNGGGTARAYTAAEVGSDPEHPAIAVVPYRTIAQAFGQLRSGYPDQLRLKKGDTFNEAFPVTRLKGRSYTRNVMANGEIQITGMMGIASYGSGPRPIIVKPGSAEYAFQSNAALLPNNMSSHFAIMGLEFRPSTNYSGSCILWTNAPINTGGMNILIEDNKFWRWKEGITISGVSNVMIRNNIFEDILDNTGAGMSPHPFYVDLSQGVLVEGNYLLMRAFQTVRLPYQQDNFGYIQDTNSGTIIIRKNVSISRGTKSHIGTALRSPGVVEDNFYSGLAMAIHIGGQDTPPADSNGGMMIWPNGGAYQVRGNFITHTATKDVDQFGDGNLGVGISVAFTNPSGSVIENNVISNRRVRTSDGAGISFDQSYMTGFARNVTVRNNILFNHHGLQTLPGRNPLSGISFLNNTVVAQNPPFPQPPALDIRNPGGVSVQGTALSATFPAPTRDLCTYAMSQGLVSACGTQSQIDAGVEQILQKMGAQSRDSWNAVYGIDAVMTYMRAGFGL
ncbi:MAG: hypothetical protein AB7F66_10060 [Bacteriovoracia bacterium]